jgi:hypothetical protein
MPRASSKKKEELDPDGVYVAWQAGSCDIDGVSYTVTTGEHRRGSDPFVQAHPWLFVPDGTTEGETPNAFSTLVERANAERAAVDFELTLSGALPEPLKVEDTIQLTRAVTVRGGYVSGQEVVTYEKDTIFPAASEVASLLPADAYEHTATQFTRAKGRRR